MVGHNRFLAFRVTLKENRSQRQNLGKKIEIREEVGEKKNHSIKILGLGLGLKCFHLWDIHNGRTLFLLHSPYIAFLFIHLLQTIYITIYMKQTFDISANIYNVFVPILLACKKHTQIQMMKILPFKKINNRQPWTMGCNLQVILTTYKCQKVDLHLYPRHFAYLAVI